MFIYDFFIGPVNRASHSRSQDMGFNSQCWPCAEMSGKFHTPHCLGPSRRNGYLVHRSKVGVIVAGCIGAHFAKKQVKPAEHVLPWSLDTTFTLTLPLCISIRY